MDEPAHRIERFRTGQRVPAAAVYMTTRDEPVVEGDAESGDEVWHYFRVPMVGPSPMLGFGGPTGGRA
jgi:hypothetical protein